MILELFTIILFLCFGLIITGYALDIPIIPIIGFFFLFLLSFTLINNDLEYKSGSYIVDNLDGTTTITNTLTNYTGYSQTIGKYLAMVSAILFILAIIRETNIYENWRERYEENNY